MSFVAKSTLPRLGREYYQGHAMVLWTHTFEHRASGWLTGTFHNQFRELLLHACGRYSVATPCYVLMPDHWHIVWMGLSGLSDQWLATSFIRKNLKRFLGAAALQDRAHDHVLREDQRERGAFQAACTYLCENPQRAALCDDWRSWAYLGGMILGYPVLDPRTDNYWEDFWEIHRRLVAGESALPGPCSPPRERRDGA